MFALDSFDGNKTVIAQIGGFLIHLIPSFVLIVLLYFSWRHEIVGAVAFLLLAIAYIVMAWGKFPISTYFIISGPMFLISILFLMNWFLKKRQNRFEII
jgi:hydrogenase-4 membrane subunit HyfE